MGLLGQEGIESQEQREVFRRELQTNLETMQDVYEMLIHPDRDEPLIQSSISLLKFRIKCTKKILFE